MKILRFLVLAFLLFFGIQLRAQTDTILKLNSTVYSVKTSDGNTIVGMILDYDESTIVVKSSSLGAVTIQRASIISITELNGHVVKVEKIWHENPGATRYFIGSSAIPMKRGHGYYQNIMLFLQAGEYGITNHISIKVGTELFNLASDRDPPSFYCLAPRIGFQVYPRIYVGGGVVYTNFPSYTNWEAIIA